MGFRYKKSLNLGGGVRLNAGKNGIGISAGTKGLRISHGADGKTRVTASIPGTGISYQETVGSKKQNRKVIIFINLQLVCFMSLQALFEIKSKMAKELHCPCY
ncbi:DUF4236 domain-containing protein [Neobacillus sp. SuZ13]|uniref:DUF4236 domain-containing protein n=1 Tax=Neobacillus sp. SuZ13 TaxID=3047875 RepID=UPI0024BF9CC3|nr:DUF4236 domain-containing protein [Neobacillus sp. SuZ13]WHY65638.1 DUF4236 domain-containing protein [Neobacillus sp. SuZ13]